MTFDCLLLETPGGPPRTVAMRVDLFVDVSPAGDAMAALGEIAAAQTRLAGQWRRTLLVNAACPRTRAAAQAHAGAREALLVAGGVTPACIAAHLLQAWAPHALGGSGLTVRRAVVCLDGWDTGSCGELAGAADAVGDAAQLPDATIPKIKRSQRGAFGRKRYIRPS